MPDHKEHPDRSLPEFQGAIKLIDKEVSTLKKLFKKELVSDAKTRNEGYFIGKNLLMEMLMEFDEADGIYISFGADNPLCGIKAVGNIQLQFEAATLKETEDSYKINILGKKNKYGTGTPGHDGPDSLLPHIKPNPAPKSEG